MKIDQLAINSISTRHATLEEGLAAYRDAGFKQVEFFLGHVKDWMQAGHTAADARRLVEDHGLRCIGGFQTTLQAFPDKDARAQNHDLVVANAELIAELGGSCLVVGTDGPPEPVADPVGALAETFGEVAGRIAPTGVTLCVEFNWSPIVKSLRTAVEVGRRSGAANVGVLFDPAHYHCTPTKFEQITPEAVSFIRHVHVNDMRDKAGELSHCNSDRVLPGEGCLDLAAIFGALDRCGYRGSYSIEMFNEDLWSMPAAEAARRMYESLLPLCG
jgi:sugar phosphate isomerase/epimerase